MSPQPPTLKLARMFARAVERDEAPAPRIDEEGEE